MDAHVERDDAVADAAREYPVQVEVLAPLRFERTQLLLRLLVVVVLTLFGVTANLIVGALYLVLPLVAAIGVSDRRTSYLGDIAPRVWRILAWLLHVSAFMMLLVDRFPTADGDVRATVQFTGRPTIGSALIRLVSSIPSAVVLAVLWCVSALCTLVALITVLLSNSVPASVLAYQRGVLRWQARLLAYHASLVDEYPPFALDTHDKR